MEIWSAVVRALVRPLVPSDAVASGSASVPPGGWDAVVVLGAAVGPDGRLGPAARERVAAGVAAWCGGWAPWLVMTGGRADGSLRADLRTFVGGVGARERGVGPAEATAMRELAIALGVPATAIMVEEAARSTAENARLTAAMLRERGLRRVLVVSQPYHLRRSIGHFRRAGVDAVALHVDASEMYAGGERSVRALRWVIREYAILAAGGVARRLGLTPESMKRVKERY